MNIPEVPSFASLPASLSTFDPQDYRKFWAGLQGLTIYFYNNNRDVQVRTGMGAQDLAHHEHRAMLRMWVVGQAEATSSQWPESHWPGAQTPICAQPLEKLDLRTFVKLTDEAPQGSTWDAGLHFSLVLRDQEVKFKVGLAEEQSLLSTHSINMESYRLPPWVSDTAQAG